MRHAVCDYDSNEVNCNCLDSHWHAGLHSATAYLFTSSVGNHVGELYNIIYSVATHLSLQIVIVVGIISAVVDAKSLFGGK